MKNLIQKGDRITYTNTGETTITSGSLVVVGALLCVACADILAGESGPLATEGVFELPKATHATDKAFTQGEALIFDVSVSKFDKGSVTADEGDITGNAVAWAAAGSTATTAYVKLSGIPGTVTPAAGP